MSKLNFGIHPFVSKELPIIREVNLLGKNQIGEPKCRSLRCDKRTSGYLCIA